jgi:hypothetical protein
MATVRPFPLPPTLLMNIVPESGIYTNTLQSIGLLNTIRDVIKKEKTGFELNLSAASTNTAIKQLGAVIVELPVTQPSAFLKSNFMYQISGTALPCRFKSEDKQLEDAKIINDFVIGKIKL